MREKILALLGAKFTGMRKDGLTALASALALQCTTEDDAKSLVEKVTDAQVTEFVRDYRKEVDKEVSESTKTFENNLRKKFEFKEKVSKSDDNVPKDNADDISAIVKAAVAEAVKPFQDKLSSYEAEGVAKSRLQTLTEKLSICKDETFKQQTLKDFSRMHFDSDDAFTEYLNEKVTDIDTANQNVANMKLGNGGSPLFSQKAESGISQGVADFLESQKPQDNNLTGKEL